MSSTYDLLLVSSRGDEVRKFRFSRRQIGWLAGVLSVALFFVAFNIAGFWYYRSLYSSLSKERVLYRDYQREKMDLSGKVKVLEGVVGQTEMMAGRLASLIGTERGILQKGIGPLPKEEFNASLKMAGFDSHLLDSQPDFQIDLLEDRVVTLQTKLKELSKIQQEKLLYMASTPSIWPVKGWITSDFGHRRSPFTFTSDFHSGIDIAASWGTPVVAPADGVITFAGYRSGYGKMVIVDHGFGIVTQYGHTARLLVHEGERIKRGAQIALVGNTGHSTGPHLHYEIRIDGTPVDPMKYILR